MLIFGLGAYQPLEVKANRFEFLQQESKQCLFISPLIEEGTKLTVGDNAEYPEMLICHIY